MPCEHYGNLHICRSRPTTDYDEQAILDSLDKHQRRYLSRRVCGGCEKPLDRAGCGAYPDTYYPEDGEPINLQCAQQIRVQRLENCLAEYRPRLTRRAAPPEVE